MHAQVAFACDCIAPVNQSEVGVYGTGYGRRQHIHLEQVFYVQVFYIHLQCL